MRFRLLWIIVLLTNLIGGTRWAAAESGPEVTGEVRDIMLLLDGGPLHLRLRISLAGESLATLRQEYVKRLIQTLDSNGDGQLTRQETARSPLLRRKQRDSARAFLESLGTPQTTSRRDIFQTVERVGGETVAYRQDNSSADNDDELFQFLDADGSGLLDSVEMAEAVQRVLNKDRDDDQCVSFAELLPEPEPEPENPQLQQDLPRRSTARISTIIRDTRSKLLPNQMIRQYDRNRDRRLSQRELGWTSERFEFLDTDGNRKLDDEELAFISRTPVDLDLAIDLEPGPSKPAVRVLAVSGQRLDVSKRSDFAKIRFPGAVITFARRYIDPVAAALENAMIEFNVLDIDGNGYLEKEETIQRIRFAHGLFEAIDFDGDGKIFGEEMEEYIRVRSEPATTSCHVTIYDTGHGFFMALDRNGDGRIGERERRLSPNSLAMMERDGREGIGAREPEQHFHIEFVRGSYLLFGAADPLVNQTPAFQQRAFVGPIWFQRMDRNGDGDLTWGEFLGPRDVFHQLDADRDALLDAQEAAAAESYSRDKKSEFPDE